MSSLSKPQALSLQISPTSKSFKILGKKSKEFPSKPSKSKNPDNKKQSSQKDLKSVLDKKASVTMRLSEDYQQKPDEIQSPQVGSFRPSHRKSSSFDLACQNSAINDCKTLKKSTKPSSPKLKKAVKNLLVPNINTKLQSKRASLEIPLNKTAEYSKPNENLLKQDPKSLKTKNLGNKLKVFERKVKKKVKSQKFEDSSLEKSISYKTFSKDSKSLKNTKAKAVKPKPLKNYLKTCRDSELVPIEESIKSSALQTENDEWVNFLDYKFQGSNSYFVEEFRQKIIKEQVTSFNLNEGQLLSHVTEDLCTEDLNLSSSESISMDYIVKVPDNLSPSKKPTLVPSLSLNLLNFEAEPPSSSDADYPKDFLQQSHSSRISEGCKSSENFIQSTKDPSLESFRVKVVPYDSFYPPSQGKVYEIDSKSNKPKNNP